MNDEFTTLLENLLIPKNDEKANHLLGRQIPNIILSSTMNSFFDFSSINKQYGILYFFPLIGMPQKELAKMKKRMCLLKK